MASYKAPLRDMRFVLFELLRVQDELAQLPPFAELDMADPDVDGDTLLDGEDDQDNDDFTNIQEMYEPVVIGMDTDGDGGFNCGGTTYPSLDMDPGAAVDPWAVNAFNPCAPNPDSRTCAVWKPFE